MTEMLNNVVPMVRGTDGFMVPWSKQKIVEQLIKQYKIAVIPGHAFGMDEGCYLRISYGALGKEIAADGVNRLTNGLKSILQ